MFKDCFKNVSRTIEACLEGVLRVFKGILKKFKGYFKEGSKMFQGSLKVVSRVSQ